MHDCALVPDSVYGLGVKVMPEWFGRYLDTVLEKSPRHAAELAEWADSAEPQDVVNAILEHVQADN